MKHNGWNNYETWRIALEIFDGLNPKDYGWDFATAEELKNYAEEVVLDSDQLKKDYALAFINDVNWYEIAENINDNYGLSKPKGLNGKTIKPKKKYLNGFPDFTKKQRDEIMKIYFGKDNFKQLEKLKNMNGFSRAVVSPTEEMNGFSRMDYIIDGYTLNDYTLNETDELNGRQMRKIKRFYKRNAPWSYVGTIALGLLAVDIATGGKVRESLGMKKKKRR